MERRMELTAPIHAEDGVYWAEVKELPGCFAAGETLDELFEALQEGISLCLDEEPAGPLHLTSVTFTDRPLATA
jgi:predicted RNase H-like HicB family nuclease